jgi:hypothetical protein
MREIKHQKEEENSTSKNETVIGMELNAHINLSIWTKSKQVEPPGSQ